MASVGIENKCVKIHAIFSPQILFLKPFLPAATKLGQGNIFTSCVKNSVHNRPYGHSVDMLILVGHSVTYGAVGTHYAVMLSC